MGDFARKLQERNGRMKKEIEEETGCILEICETASSSWTLISYGIFHEIGLLGARYEIPLSKEWIKYLEMEEDYRCEGAKMSYLPL